MHAWILSSRACTKTGTVIEDSLNAEIEKGHDVRVKILPRDEAFQIPDLIPPRSTCCPRITEVRTGKSWGGSQADGGRT